MVKNMRYFLLVFDRAHRELIGSIEEFSDADQAVRARFVREASLIGKQDIEVVVLGAESRQALENTHSRYFEVRELTAS
jgi:hypothetical protein